MSYLPREASGYMEAIQVYFTEVTEKVAVFGARDRVLLREWKQEGRSARVVCRGIREAVKAFDEPPRSLWQCRSFVDQQWEDTRERAVGAHAPVEEQEEASDKEGEDHQPLVVQLRMAIERAGKRSDEERFREAYRKAWRRLAELAGEEGPVGLAQVEALDQALVEGYLEALSDEERQALEASLEDQHSGWMEAMSRRARRQHRQAQRKRALIEDYGLIDVLKQIK